MLTSLTFLQKHQRLRSQRQLYNICDNSTLIHMVNSLDSKYYINSNYESVNKLLLALACNYPKQTWIAKVELCLNCYRHSSVSTRMLVRDQISPLLHQCQAYSGACTFTISQSNTWSCIYSPITTCYYCSRVINWYQLLSLLKLFCTQLCPWTCNTQFLSEILNT